jgi:hypothetical protein
MYARARTLITFFNDDKDIQLSAADFSSVAGGGKEKS